MAIKNVSDDIKSVLERVSAMCSKTESVLNLCMTGFIKNNVELLDDADKISQAIHMEENVLIDMLTGLAAKPDADDADKVVIKSLMAVVGHIEMATDMLDNILRHVRAKVSKKILFSDKGTEEVRSLFKETLDILKTAGDAVLTRNEVLRKYIADKCESISKTVDAYSEEHEERLIKGLCAPQSSSLYLSIVDSQAKVVWHFKQAIKRLFESD